MSIAPKSTELHDLVALPKRLSEFFHMVNRLIPDDQVVDHIPPDMPASEALQIMSGRGFSQLPVKQGDSVLGLFTYRAFALEVAQINDPRVNALSLPVFEFLEHEKPAYARLSDEFKSLIDVLDQKDAVVVSGPDDLVAILTPIDVVRYLYTVANAFVLIEEIELALRSLINQSIPDETLFQTCVKNALSKKYKEDELPARLEDMTFGDYVSVLQDGRNWKHFEPFFGGIRERIAGKLEPAGRLRNDVFHFRRELSAEDHQDLTVCRDWLLRCVRKVRARAGVER